MFPTFQVGMAIAQDCFPSLYSLKTIPNDSCFVIGLYSGNSVVDAVCRSWMLAVEQIDLFKQHMLAICARPDSLQNAATFSENRHNRS